MRGDAGARLALGLPRRARPHGADGRGHAPLLPPAGLVVMHIVVMGAGGVGGYFGAKLVRAGERVTMVARGAQLEALRRDGLRRRFLGGGNSERCASSLGHLRLRHL